MSIISIKGVSKFFGPKQSRITAVKDVDLEIPKGSFTVILGRSGSGKSTLLNLMAGLDAVSTGEIHSNGYDLSKIGRGKLAKYRAGVGIIFQFYNLMPNLDTLHNVLMGGYAGGLKTSKEEAKELLEFLGLGHRLHTNVKLLSGGEKQRVAIARSLVGDPEILFCDEPTGALDSQSEKNVQDILVKLNKEKGKTIVLVTHNPEFQEFASQIITMSDGSIISQTGSQVEAGPEETKDPSPVADDYPDVPSSIDDSTTSEPSDGDRKPLNPTKISL
jgi:ABC-type lipoprotein export system ATPase subunit